MKRAERYWKQCSAALPRATRTAIAPTRTTMALPGTCIYGYPRLPSAGTIYVLDRRRENRSGHGKGWKRWRACGFARNSSPQNNSHGCCHALIEAMRFGDLPNWARVVSGLIRRSCSAKAIFDSKGPENAEGTGRKCPLPTDLLWREPLFDQLIANAYEPGEGICAHVDLMKFEDGIAIISLQSMCVMHFTPVDDQPLGMRRIPVLLTPGSLVLMSGEARYLWKHEINRKPGFQIWEGEEITQHRRTSVTLRRLCQPAS